MRCKRLRFSLSTLLVLMTVLAVWLGLYVKRFRDHRQAIAAIERLGATFAIKYDPGKAWLLKVLGDEKYFYDPVAVNFHATNHRVTDDDLTNVIPSLTPFPNLAVVDLDNSQITDHGLVTLLPLKGKLDTLDLRGTKVSDACIEVLKKFPLLAIVRLSPKSVTPAAIAELQKALPNCRIEYERAPHYRP